MAHDSKAPQLAKNRAAFVRNRAKKSSKVKDHGFDPRSYHQNANRHGIHSLTTFNCPVCECKNTIRVELSAVQRLATVKCIYCIALKPRPVDLPYPYTTEYVPRLENKADAFFRFSEAYQRLLQQQPPPSHQSQEDGDAWNGDSEEDEGYSSELYSDASRGPEESTDMGDAGDGMRRTHENNVDAPQEPHGSAPSMASGRSDAETHVVAPSLAMATNDVGDEHGDVVDDVEAFFCSDEDEG